MVLKGRWKKEGSLVFSTFLLVAWWNWGYMVKADQLLLDPGGHMQIFRDTSRSIEISPRKSLRISPDEKEGESI